MKSDKPFTPDPKRFEVSKATLWFDRLMGWGIRFGGIAVIVAVFGIFYFIGKEVVPLFHSGEVTKSSAVKSETAPLVLGVDEWGELPFFYSGGSKVVFVDAKNNQRSELEIPGFAELKVTAISYDVVKSRVAVGLEDGRVGSFLVSYKRAFENGEAKGVIPEIVSEPWFELKVGSGPVTKIAYGDSGDSRIIVAKRGAGTERTVEVLKLGMKGGLIGGKTLKLISETDISAEIDGEITMIRASQDGQIILVANDKGEVAYLLADSSGVTKRQVFTPFAGSPLAEMDFLFGGVSTILTAEDGTQQQWSLYRVTEDAERMFGMTKEFPNIGPEPKTFAKSQRNRTFITGAGRKLSIRHSTSGATRWDGELDIDPVALTLDAKGQSFWVASANGEAQKFAVDDHHPDAGMQAFFGKVWYEGGAGPVYQWQSTGGTDDFEAKFSLMPLIFGSLKGTTYALIFSVPIALLAAVFSAAFLPASVKQVIKPTMEIMSSLPSVVLGFLAGLWLAPILEDRVPSVMMMVILIPTTALIVGYFWCRMPLAFRNRFAGGFEWAIIIPFLALAAMIGWWSGPIIENIFFVYTEPGTGKQIADFKLWWPQATGTRFEQRNSLVLGFIMGFAVIPVIFTIAEDALSNVPKNLTAAASALGANRWQVLWTVMLPIASSGIFSALMIGFGRAVGETMVMVMATGNTPITEWNLFSGMRTLAANIAVELPEAPVGSTHYRTLFLGAVVLFAMTFVMNTIAEVLRQRLREKNKLVYSMPKPNKKSLKAFATTGRSRKGEPLVWLTAGGLAIGVLMALGLFLLILVKGASSFWPKRIELFEVKRGDQTEMIAGYVTEVQTRTDAKGKEVDEIQIFRANKDLNGEAFIYVDSRDIISRSTPENILLIERLTYGPAIGHPVALVTKDKRIENGEAKFAKSLEATLKANTEIREKLLRIERKQIGRVSAAIEELGFDEKAERITPEQAQAQRAELQKEFDTLKAKADALYLKMEETSLMYRVADGREKTLESGQLLAVFGPNDTGFFGRLGETFRRAWHFLSEDPREANMEGGVFPAIFGTVVMTLTMSLFVTPFGVIAAIYLREYAKQGLLVRIVRVCVNNLAGVPSIVFGVFGLAFFVYIVGANIDQTFYSEKLPTPTFGTPGILWASLTLALLTLPVVIVATEEALSSVPRGVREAALACGASKWQTIQRVVLPASLPGILTGVILAMARGACEVAPLMIVGVVKLAPSLPIDDIAPFIHAERKFMHLGFHIYDLGFQSPDAEAAKPMVYATALLLIIVVVTLNLAAILIRNRLKKRFAVSSF